ncbi:hypothetical protein ACFLTB_03380 [Chloroflexota bacterium]
MKKLFKAFVMMITGTLLRISITGGGSDLKGLLSDLHDDIFKFEPDDDRIV